jgi:hypothetical protein
MTIYRPFLINPIFPLLKYYNKVKSHRIEGIYIEIISAVINVAKTISVHQTLL